MENSNFKVLTYIFSQLSKKKFLLTIIISLSIAVLDIAGIFIIFPYVSAVIEEKAYLQFNQLGYWTFSSQKSFVLAITGLLILTYLVKAVVSTFLIKKQNQIIANYTKEVTDAFLHKLLHTKFETFQYLSTSRLAGITFSNTIHASLLLQSVIQIISELIFIGLLFSIFMISLPLFGIGLIAITIFFFIFVYRPLGTKVSKLGEIQNSVENQRHQILHSIVGSIRDIKIMGLSSIFEDVSRKVSQEFCQVNWKYSTYQGITKISLETLILIALLVLIQVLLIGNFSIENAAPLVGVIVVSTLRALPSITKLLYSLNSYRYSKPFVEKLATTQTTLINSQQKKLKDNLAYEKRFLVRDVSFSYGEAQILDNINIELKKGESVGIVGSSGAGKSTLLDIITGLLEPKAGSFYLDDVRFYPFSSATLHKILGYVPQSISLLTDSLAYNIAFERQPDEKKLMEVIKMANLDTFVSSLPMKHETILGEGGIALSGGQRQRIGIARALYKKPEILIFDEATSALDVISEKALAEEIFKLKGKLTTIIVAHKLTNVIHCDCIYVLNKGRVIAKGTHEELLKSCEQYSIMFEIHKNSNQ